MTAIIPKSLVMKTFVLGTPVPNGVIFSRHFSQNNPPEYLIHIV